MAKRYRRRAGEPRSWAAGESVRPVPSVPERKPRPRWRPGYWLRHPSLGLPFAALLVLIVVGCGLGSLPSETAEHRERTVGTVRELHGRQWWASVSFTTRSGQKITTWIHYLPWDEPTVGEEVAVTYEPANPIASAALPDHEPTYRLLGILLGVGGAVLALAYPWWLWRNWKRLRNDAEAWRQWRPVPRLGARR
ncbi:DUF3592 domain-containing protein [Micromonospora sp. DPT]|uniref:DUF3592 domain-containing protein n=1 Tax=Micromonospora sp. DPT TaxID=3142975 RepID=UPI003208D884